MPRRRRHRERSTEQQLDPVSQFGRMLRESQEREQAERDRARRERREAAAAAQAAAEQAAALQDARRDLDRAIDAVRNARSTRRGVAEADAAWREAKSRVIELETGEPPPWNRSGNDGAAADAADHDAASRPDDASVDASE